MRRGHSVRSSNAVGERGHELRLASAVTERCVIGSHDVVVRCVDELFEPQPVVHEDVLVVWSHDIVAVEVTVQQDAFIAPERVEPTHH
jgi:hypothetical protein